MSQRYISMRASIGVIVLLMGLLGVLLAVTTGNIYQRFVLENQKSIFQDLADIKINLVLSDTIKKVTDLGMSIQADHELRKAFRNRDTQQIDAHLHDQFHQFVVSMSLLELQQLYVMDRDLNIVGYADEGEGGVQEADIPCPGVVEQARARKGYARLKALSGLCMTGLGARIAVLVPLGGLRVEGYLLLGVDPSTNLAHVEEELGMPLKLTYANGDQVYVSDEWNAQLGQQGILYWRYILTGMDANPVYTFHFTANMTPLFAKLEEIRENMFIIAALATLFAAMISIVMMQRTAIDPLAKLTRHLRLVRKDKKHLGEKIHVRGSREMIELAERFNDMSSELNVMYKTLEKMAFTDLLTRLPNRAVFYDRLGQAINTVQWKGKPFSLMMMDLDRFKWVNDNLGHHVGDKLLKEVAGRLRSCIRKSDTVARLGGDEFAVLLPGVDYYMDAQILARKIVEAISRPIMIDGHDLACGVSIGIVHCPEHGCDSDLLVQRADMAMYHAKGRQLGFAIYDPGLGEHELERLALAEELKNAIYNGDLEIHYQPKIDLIDGQVIDIEALVRWKHPVRGYLLPEQFVPLMEQNDLSYEMTQWVFERVTQDCAVWHKRRIMVGVSINLSWRNLGDMKITELAKASIKRSGIHPRQICLELTEEIMTSNAEPVFHVLKSLHEQGMRLSVDGFGRGHFSWMNLERLPLAEIKIDQALIQRMEQDDGARVLVQSMVELARNLGLKTVAKGVESQRTKDLLVELGCDAAQGYFFCRPCNVNGMSAWLINNKPRLFLAG